MHTGTQTPRAPWYDWGLALSSVHPSLSKLASVHQGGQLDPPMGGDDGCRTMRKPLRFSEQKVSPPQWPPFEQG